MTDFTELDEKKPYGYIYKIDFPNDKVYIGLTISLQQRKSVHKWKANTGNTTYLYNALRKYNMVDTFELIVIDTADTEEELCEKEIGYILMYNSLDKEYGYNMTYGGEGVNGYHHTEDNREKMSELKMKYHKEHPNARKEHSERLKALYKNYPDIRLKISETLKKCHQENPHLRKKAKEKAIERFEKPEEREKAREKAIEQFKNPEAKKKHSEALIKYHKEHPNAGKEHGEAMKKCHEENPQIRKKILDTKGLNKPFDVFTKDGTFIKTFNYQMDAIEYLKKEHNITSTIKISCVLNGRRKSSAGFMFKYK